MATAAAAGEEPDATAADGRQVITPAPSDRLILNPQMGWMVFGNAETFDEQTLAYASVGYRRFDWAELQPEEGRFDWSSVEAFLDGWASRGKQAAFGVIAANSHSREPFVTPRWVFDAGAEYVETEVTGERHGRPGMKVVPDFDHPVFMEKLAGFLEAFAAKYDGDPRVAFIDIRSYGNWGEGHMGHLGGYPPISDEAFIEHLKLHRDAFEQTRLMYIANDDHKRHRAVAEWAVEHGIGLRRDGVMGNSDGSETALGHGKVPGVFEWYQSYEVLKREGMWDGTSPRRGYGHPLAGCVERGRPSWVQMGYWGGKNVGEFLRAERRLVDQLSKRIGYRLVPTKIDVPRQIELGESFGVEWSLANRGVAYVLFPASVAFALFGAEGQPVEKAWADGADSMQWVPDRVVAQALVARFSQAAPGEYTLCVGVFSEGSLDSPDVAMAVEGVREDRWLPIAKVEVLPRGDTE